MNVTFHSILSPLLLLNLFMFVSMRVPIEMNVCLQGEAEVRQINGHSSEEEKEEEEKEPWPDDHSSSRYIHRVSQTLFISIIAYRHYLHTRLRPKQKKILYI